VAEIHDIVFDCAHPASSARFWAAVTGYEVAPYDEAELERLRAKGIHDPEDDPMVVVESGPGVHPRLLFQLVPEPRIAKNRVHLDLACPDLPTETARVLALGTSVVAKHAGWTTFADPEGNEFCVSEKRD
jgi:glyoxalase superfamily protein